MQIINLGEIRDLEFSDQTSGALYCYTYNYGGQKNIHRVLLVDNLSQVIRQINGERYGRVFLEDWFLKGKDREDAVLYEKIYIDVHLMEWVPYANSDLAKRIKQAIYKLKQEPLLSYNKFADINGWEKIESRANLYLDNKVSLLISEIRAIKEQIRKQNELLEKNT